MNEELFSKIESFQNLLIDFATGGDWDEEMYSKKRKELLANEIISKEVPDFIKTTRTAEQFWHFIKQVSSNYAGRRMFLWDSFSELLNIAEKNTSTPGENSISEKLKSINEVYIKQEWDKALKRKTTDPEGAITTSRTLIETVCKHILENKKIEYSDNLDLPKLYKLTAKQLNLAPDQHTEKIFKQILNGCQSVVEGLGGIRNKLSDSHGKGIAKTKPSERHAELAVNLAGAMTLFLFESSKK